MSAAKGGKLGKRSPSAGPIASNRRARFEYEILETLEAGVVLTGAEIKSVRSTGMSLEQSYIRPFQDEVYLLGAHIKPYSHSGAKEYEPERPRKLLLRRDEIKKLIGRVATKGLTIVPLSAYFKRGFLKLEVALARGKASPDKRQATKKRELDREAQAAMKRRG